jgi:hypothetical protein
MKDDELLRGLKQVFHDEKIAREGDRPFEALADGTLSERERAELEALAAADPVTADKLDAYRPLGADFEESMAQSFLASPSAVTAITSAPAAPVKKAGPASGRVARIGLLIATPLAMAAAVALVVRQSGQGTSVDGLPTYELTVMGNAQQQRAGEPLAAAGEVHLHPNAFFEATARPAVPAKEGIGARAAIVRDGHARAWAVPLDLSPEGAVHIAGPAATLFPETRGAYDIVVALGRPGALPDDRALFACAESVSTAQGKSGPCDGYRVVRSRVVFVAE